jgi:hypothetical protein
MGMEHRFERLARRGLRLRGGLQLRQQGCSRTQRIAASQMASLVGKCLNTAPWVTPMAAGDVAGGDRRRAGVRARFNAAATISAWRSSVGSLVCMVEVRLRRVCSALQGSSERAV